MNLSIEPGDGFKEGVVKGIILANLTVTPLFFAWLLWRWLP